MFLKFCNPQTQLLEILNILENFRQLSGLKTNVSKTKYALFGNAIDSPEISKETRVTCETEPYRLLGIYLNGNVDNLDINWEKAIKAIKTEIGIWSSTELSTTAKVNITKACLLSKITHIATILPLPKSSIIKEIEQTIYRFINGKRNKYKKEIIFTPTHAGGLGIPSLVEHWTSLQCSWLKRTHLSKDIWNKILNPEQLDSILFLANPPSAAQMFRMDNPFWSQVLERWKKMLSEIPKNLSCNYENICKIPIISQQFPQNKNIPIRSIINENYEILPPSQLRIRLPEINWNVVSLNLLSIATRSIRNKCKRITSFNGNFLPNSDPILLATLPSRKGCKHLANAMFPNTFNPKHWGTLEKFTADHNLPPNAVAKQIMKLARTSKIPEAKDLQYMILRNTCITNNKLFKWKIKDSPMCSLCKHPTQNSTHRFYSCPRIKPIWEFLSEITKNTSIEHAYTETCSILNVLNVPKNHPLILLTNYTRKLIDSAHCNDSQIHTNTMLYKILNMSDIFSYKDARFSLVWSDIKYKCKEMLRPFNPQLL